MTHSEWVYSYLTGTFLLILFEFSSANCFTRFIILTIVKTSSQNRTICINTFVPLIIFLFVYTLTNRMITFGTATLTINIAWTAWTIRWIILMLNFCVWYYASYLHSIHLLLSSKHLYIDYPMNRNFEYNPMLYWHTVRDKLHLNWYHWIDLWSGAFYDINQKEKLTGNLDQHNHGSGYNL